MSRHIEVIFVLGFNLETGRQVSIRRLSNGEALPVDHFQPETVYGFYAGSESAVTPKGTLMMTSPGLCGIFAEYNDKVPTHMDNL